MSERKPYLIVAALVLAMGPALAGYFIGNAVLNMKRVDRYVTVKGLVERDVRADAAIWTIGFNASGNDLNAVYAQIDSAQGKITNFLLNNGFKPEDYATGQWRVSDMKSREYSGNPNADRYIVEAAVNVSTDKIDTVLMTAKKTGELVKDGVVLTGANLNFRFTQLNDIKPEMLAEATKNARAAAEQFAADSKSSVGQIRQANQGVFSIIARSGDYDDPAAVDKRVRVVTTVDYYLE